MLINGPKVDFLYINHILQQNQNSEKIWPLQNNKKFFEDKIETAKFFFDRVLPRIDTHYKSGISGSKSIMNFKFN